MPNVRDEAFRFSVLFPLRDQIAEMPPLEPFLARDGVALHLRRYRSDPITHLILLHGSSGHGAYLHAFAKNLSQRGVATVYLPDLRGHGLSPQRRGDIDYEHQLEDDLADLILHIRKDAPPQARIIVGGHSSGGGLALRFGGGRHGHLTDGLVLLAPFLGHGAPMTKRGAGGWARPNIPRIVGLSILSGIGIERLGGLPVLHFNLPERYRTGYETLTYSFRLMRGMHPRNYAASLRATKVPLLLVVGAEDEAFHAEGFKAGVTPYKPDALIRFVDGGSHLGILMSEPAMQETARWLESIARHNPVINA